MSINSILSLCNAEELQLLNEHLIPDLSFMVAEYLDPNPAFAGECQLESCDAEQTYEETLQPCTYDRGLADRCTRSLVECVTLRQAYGKVLEAKTDEEALKYFPVGRTDVGRDELLCILTQLMIESLGTVQEIAVRARGAGLEIKVC